MQEQQGNLEEPMSNLPGPRPFNKKNKKGIPMEDKKETNNIVEMTADILGTGKSFGGWSDSIEESSARRKAETRKKGKYQYGTGPKPYQGSPKGKGAAKEDDVYQARSDGQGNQGDSNSLSGGSANIKRHKEIKARVAKRKADVISKTRLAAGVEHDGNNIQEFGPVGGSVKEGAKGAAAGAAIGSIVPGIGTAIGGLLGYALGDAGAAVTGVGKKKKTWDDK